MLEKNVRNELLKVCKLIRKHHIELEKEFSVIEQLLNAAEEYGIAYMQKPAAKNHFMASMKNIKTSHIKLILLEIGKISEEACYEFTRGMDICNMCNEIIKVMSNSDYITKIWDMKKELQYVIHSIRRIEKEENEDKKIAILKGMLAYY